MYRESCQWGRGNKPVDQWDCRSLSSFFSFFFFRWPGSQLESQWVLLSHSVSSSFCPPERASGVSKTAVLSLYALGGFGASNPGHEKGQTNKDWRGRTMKSKMRRGMNRNDEEAGGGGGRGVLFTSRHVSGLRVRWWCCTAGTASCSPESWASILHNARASTGWKWVASCRSPCRWDTCIGLLSVSASPALWFEPSEPPW